MEKEYVWYACYGANLSRERFIGRYIRACADKTEPAEDRPYILHCPLYFAGGSSWEGKGAAFLGNQRDGAAITFGRVYKITAAQMDTVQKEEGDKPHWYGNRVPLGTLDGLPVCTLTRMPEHDFTRPNLPSGKYLETIRLGLAETYPGLDADAYLDRALRRTEVLNLDARAAGT